MVVLCDVCFHKLVIGLVFFQKIEYFCNNFIIILLFSFKQILLRCYWSWATYRTYFYYVCFLIHVYRALNLSYDPWVLSYHLYNKNPYSFKSWYRRFKWVPPHQEWNIHAQNTGNESWKHKIVLPSALV